MVDSSLFINQHDYFFNSETTALNFPAFVRGISSTYSNFTFMVGLYPLRYIYQQFLLRSHTIGIPSHNT